MSKSENYKPLKAAIDKLLEVYKIDKKFHEIEVKKAYKSLMGNMISAKTEDLWLKKGVLHIRLNSSVLRQELSMNKTKIADMINDKIGEQLIKDVVIK